jgi:ABC-type phosphate transport system substrate-binding protein
MVSLSLVLAVTIAGSTAAEAVSVIVHPDSEITLVSRAELSKIFLGRLRTWSNGTPVLPVDQLPDRPVRERFSRHVHGRSVVTIEVYWKRMIFSGRGVPPNELDNDQRVLEFVHTHPGAVGYISGETEPVGVHVLRLQD